MDQPEGSADLPVLEMPGDVERTFVLDDFSALAGVRRWVRWMLPDGCAVRDECVLVASELAANVVRHGGGGRVALSIGHGSGVLRGELVHPGAPAETPKARTAALLEIARLLGLRPGDEPDVESLAEDGRGLVVVASACQGAVDIVRDARGLVIRWELAGCGCTDGPSC